MGTKNYTFVGEAQWAKIYEGQLDTQFDASGYWSIDVAVENTADFKASGSQLRPKKTSKDNPELKKSSTGHYFYGFKRKGDQGPVLVFAEDGSPFDETIGNGSRVSINVEVYDYTYQGKKGKGTRLISVTVLELVEYKPEEEVGEMDAPKVAKVPVNPPVKKTRTFSKKVL